MVDVLTSATNSNGRIRDSHYGMGMVGSACNGLGYSNDGVRGSATDSSGFQGFLCYTVPFTRACLDASLDLTRAIPV